ncbi:hypothetical protein AAC03nite_05180 [Alicyclobacillus acidoterrestris]|nr:hypothetical protein AAC03nite_05180 [Alicyclobacillus acidoterrestris]
MAGAWDDARREALPGRVGHFGGTAALAAPRLRAKLLYRKFSMVNGDRPRWAVFFVCAGAPWACG